MGRWFANFLLKDGKEVIITGRNEKKLLEAKQQLGVEVATNLEAVKSADVVLLSVPIDNFEEVVDEISPHIRSEQIIVDITSIKAMPVEVMHRYLKTGSVLGTHPVFGPGARDLTSQNFVLTPTNVEEKALAEKVKEYLEARSAVVTLMTPDEHDGMMAVVLGLAHFISIVSADTLVSLDRLPLMRAIGGSTYRVLVTLIESVISEDPVLYATLQTSFPRMTEIEELFQRNSRTWAELVKNKDRQGFIERMTALKDKMEQANPDFGKAYENMYKIIEKL